MIDQMVDLTSLIVPISKIPSCKGRYVEITCFFLKNMIFEDFLKAENDSFCCSTSDRDLLTVRGCPQCFSGLHEVIV